MRALAGPANGAGNLLLVLTASLMHSRLFAPVPYALWQDQRGLWWTVFAIILLAVSYAYGLPELAGSRTGAAGRGLAAAATAFIVISAAQVVLATPLLPRSSSLVVGLTVPVWSVISWHLAHDVDQWGASRDRVFAVVASTDDVIGLHRDLAEGAERSATVVDHLLVDEVLAAPSRSLVVERFDAAGANLLVMDAASHAVTPIIEQAALIHRRGSRVRTLSLFYEEWVGKLPHSELARVSLLFDVGELHRRRYVRAKRLVDLAFAAAGLVALMPVMVVVRLLNPVLNPGPLLYRQERVGKDGRPFTILKLRTMRPDVGGGTGSLHRPGDGGHWDQDGGLEDGGVGHGVWTAADDDRITPLGRWLRRTHLDELPQVVNILSGDLSLVGPRPEQPHYVEQLVDKIDFFDARHMVRPGLTGWAQVKQGYAGDEADAFDKLQYDFYYLRRQGIRLDARIIWRTIRGVAAGTGR